MKARFLAILFFPLAATAQVPNGYYNGTQGLSGSTLQSALHGIIDGHTDVGYTPGLWNAYYTTDKKPASGTPGKLWTIYSDKPDSTASPYEFDLGTDQCSGNTPSAENGCYNREHLWPRSFFGGQVPPMNSDLWIVYPTDAYVNGRRQTFPFGQVTAPTWRSRNGTKVGPQTFTGAPTGTAFEPIDSFKGDVARSYFYVATRYLGEDASWSDWEMAAKAVLKPWAVQMLMQWHQLDPVSTKERLRNNAVYAFQGNRNPFIDSPGFVQCIWGTGGCSGLGIDAAADAGFSVAPNPATSMVQVRSQAGTHDAVVEIIDVQGRVWLRQKVDEEAEMLDVKPLPRGIWVMRLTSASGVATRLFILQ